jgi:glycosyltransferase involved in cell wall biosynthesis
MKVLLLSTDELTAQFDRRIVDLAQCIVECGDEVVIQTIGKHAKFQTIQGQTVVQFPRSYRKSSADLARNAFFDRGFLVGHINPFGEMRLKSFARLIWSQLPNHLKWHVHNLYSKFKYLSGISLKNVNPKSMADFYFSDAYSFWEANHQGEYDLVIGTDLSSGIAAALLTEGSSKSWWYEAHEYATEQQWLKEHFGFTPELIDIEKKLVQQSNVFSSVSKELVLHMSEFFGRNRESIVLHNSTRSRQANLSAPDPLPKMVLEAFQVPDHVIVFHGVLSDLRGLSKFVEAFESASIPNWKFVLIGYNPGIQLLNAIKNARNCVLLDPINSNQVSEIVRMSDVVLMPYPVSDLNTKYGFANKLGDCIAENVPFLYNQELEAINNVATLTKAGIPFSWSDLSHPGELQKILLSFDNLTPDWECAEKLYGWTNFETTIAELLGKFRQET